MVPVTCAVSTGRPHRVHWGRRRKATAQRTRRKSFVCGCESQWQSTGERPSTHRPSSAGPESICSTSASQASPGVLDRAASMPAGVGEVLLRLDDARLQQIEAMRKLADSEKRCTQLQEMVSALQKQCAQLTEERDHASLEAHGAHELQAALEQSESYREQAEGQLRHARKATELRLAAEANVARAQADARRTTGAAQSAGGRLPQPAGIGLDLRPFERIGEVLQAVQDQLAEQDEGLDELRSHLGVGGQRVVADSASPQVISGEVVARHDDPRPADSGHVHASPGDNADNAVTSTDIAPAAGPSVVVQALSPADLGRVGVLRARAGVEESPCSA